MHSFAQNIATCDSIYAVDRLTFTIIISSATVLCKDVTGNSILFWFVSKVAVIKTN